jgi:hypothetical protein
MASQKEDGDIQEIHPTEVYKPPVKKLDAKERALKVLKNWRGSPTAFNPAVGAYTDMAYEAYKKLTGNAPLEDLSDKARRAAKDTPKMATEKFAAGGKVRQIDGCAQRGKTKGRVV